MSRLRHCVGEVDAGRARIEEEGRRGDWAPVQHAEIVAPGAVAAEAEAAVHLADPARPALALVEAHGEDPRPAVEIALVANRLDRQADGRGLRLVQGG